MLRVIASDTGLDLYVGAIHRSERTARDGELLGRYNLAGGSRDVVAINVATPTNRPSEVECDEGVVCHVDGVAAARRSPVRTTERHSCIPTTSYFRVSGRRVRSGWRHVVAEQPQGECVTREIGKHSGKPDAWKKESH